MSESVYEVINLPVHGRRSKSASSLCCISSDAEPSVQNVHIVIIGQMNPELYMYMFSLLFHFVTQMRKEHLTIIVIV